jgi:hypothetical protein
MATQADVRRIALALPETEEEAGRFAFAVCNKEKLKGFVWVWLERVEPKKARVANPGVIAARVANLAQKDLLISADPVKFFTEPHYNGFPAVLVRLAEVSKADLEVIIAEAWRCQAPKSHLVPRKAVAAQTRRPVAAKKPRSAKRASPRRRDAK